MRNLDEFKVSKCKLSRAGKLKILGRNEAQSFIYQHKVRTVYAALAPDVLTQHRNWHISAIFGILMESKAAAAAAAQGETGKSARYIC